MMHNAHLHMHTFIGIGTHKALIPPSVVPVILPHISMDTLLGLTIKAKYSKTVIGPLFNSMIGKENDSGMIVPHISIPPTNALLPIIILFGSSKVMFTASTVVMDVDGASTPVAAACFPFVPLSLNQQCNDPCNYPCDLVISPNTVVVGLTAGDILGGIAGIVIDVGISAIANYLGGKIADGLFEHIGGPIAAYANRELAESIIAAGASGTAKDVAREIAENVLEGTLVQTVKEGVGKIIEGLIGDALGDRANKPADTAIHEAADGTATPGASSSTTPATAPTATPTAAPNTTPAANSGSSSANALGAPAADDEPVFEAD